MTPTPLPPPLSSAPPMTAPAVVQSAGHHHRTAVKRACDACKIRKVRCSAHAPCMGCVAIGIPCTFNKSPGTRGPRRLRAKTIRQIEDIQSVRGVGLGLGREDEEEGGGGAGEEEGRRSGNGRSDREREQRDGSGSQGRAEDEREDVRSQASTVRTERTSGGRSGMGLGLPLLPAPRAGDGVPRSLLRPPETELPPLVASPPTTTSFGGSVVEERRTPSLLTPVATLTLQLCVYRLRMFPVWPIVAVEDLMAALQKDSSNMEAYALANAVGAATIAQLKLDPLRNSAEVVTGASMEAEVQRVRRMQPMKLNNNRLRTSFFLHVYHENQEAGGIDSLIYLREALTMAQLMGLHREASYEGLSREEQQFRKRVLWLLFVTERGVAMLHKLPVVLKSNVSFPVMEYDEEVSILPAFRKLVNLFWIFDQSGAFDILHNPTSGSSTPERYSTNQSVISLLQKRLKEIPIESGATNDIQAADICVTRAWMRAVLWRMSTVRKPPSSSSSSAAVSTPADPTTSPTYPAQIATEFLSVISALPATAIEAHGPSMELKVYEIACALIDSIYRSDLHSSQATRSPSEASYDLSAAMELLERLQRILASCRGGNTALIERLQDRISELQNPRSQIHLQQHQFQQQNGIMHSSPHSTSHLESGLDRWGSSHTPSQTLHQHQGNQNANHHHQQQHATRPAVINGEAYRSDSGGGSAAMSPPGFSTQADIGTGGQFASFPWDALAQEGEGGGIVGLNGGLVEFGGGFDGLEQGGGVLDRFLGEGVGDSWSIARTTSTVANQWL